MKLTSGDSVPVASVVCAGPVTVNSVGEPEVEAVGMILVSPAVVTCSPEAVPTEKNAVGVAVPMPTLPVPVINA